LVAAADRSAKQVNIKPKWEEEHPPMKLVTSRKNTIQPMRIVNRVQDKNGQWWVLIRGEWVME
jgi:hypothetical protein